ncbi:MAG: polysaccharide deacetylase family protein [Cyanobacteria bacterium P01_D01_bin.73]
MVALGSFIGGAGAIAAHSFLGSSSVNQAPTLAVTPIPFPSASSLKRVSDSVPRASGSFDAGSPMAPAAGFGREGEPESPALASFTSTAIATTAETAEVDPNDPIAQLWTQPVTVAQQQVEQIDIRYRIKSGIIPQQFRGKVIYGGGVPIDNKVIALTFDDGPWSETTAAAMNLLKQHGGKGTFFVIGNLVRRYPDLVKRMVADGHEVANHTWTHRLAYSSPAIAAREIDNTAAEIAKYTGFQTRIYRPPGGVLNNGLASYARNKGYAVLMWSTDTLDWRYRQAESIRQRVLRSLKPGEIVLMHDGGGPRWATVEALAKLLPELKAKGYRFVTVSELLWIREQQTRQAAKQKQQITQQGTATQQNSQTAQL